MSGGGGDLCLNLSPDRDQRSCERRVGHTGQHRRGEVWWNSRLDGHRPLSVYTADGFTFVKCACGRNPVPLIWRDEHWQGDPGEGERLVRATVSRQSADAAGLSTEDVAARLGVAASTVRAYNARRQMPEPTGHLGRTPYWAPEVVESWIEGYLHGVASLRRERARKRAGS